MFSVETLYDAIRNIAFQKCIKSFYKERENLHCHFPIFSPFMRHLQEWEAALLSVRAQINNRGSLVQNHSWNNPYSYVINGKPWIWSHQVELKHHRLLKVFSAMKNLNIPFLCINFCDIICYLIFFLMNCFQIGNMNV